MLGADQLPAASCALAVTVCGPGERTGPGTEGPWNQAHTPDSLPWSTAGPNG